MCLKDTVLAADVSEHKGECQWLIERENWENVWVELNKHLAFKSKHAQ